MLWHRCILANIHSNLRFGGEKKIKYISLFTLSGKKGSEHTTAKGETAVPAGYTPSKPLELARAA